MQHHVSNYVRYHAFWQTNTRLCRGGEKLFLKENGTRLGPSDLHRYLSKSVIELQSRPVHWSNGRSGLMVWTLSVGRNSGSFIRLAPHFLSVLQGRVIKWQQLSQSGISEQTWLRQTVSHDGDASDAWVEPTTIGAFNKDPMGWRAEGANSCMPRTSDTIANEPNLSGVKA